MGSDGVIEELKTFLCWRERSNCSLSDILPRSMVFGLSILFRRLVLGMQTGASPLLVRCDGSVRVDSAVVEV